MPHKLDFSQRKNAPPKGGAVITLGGIPQGKHHVYTKFIPPVQATTAARVSHGVSVPARYGALTISIQITAISVKSLFDSEIGKWKSTG
jgi:hypothetical protein